MGRLRKPHTGILRRVDYAKELPNGKYELKLICGHSVVTYVHQKTKRSARCVECLT